METRTKVGERDLRQSQIQFETPAWQKMDTSTQLGNTPFCPACIIMVSPCVCASDSSLITLPAEQ